MKKFNIPEFYRSPLISKVKELRKQADPKKKDFSPTLLDFGSVQFYLARHFGFCYGVENAIEISFKAVQENPDKNIYLISQMIHNPSVNADLESYGVKFIMDTAGNSITPWENISKEDVVIIPAFGTTLEIEEKLKTIGVELYKYNTTCPFVERVWKKSDKLGEEDYTIIIHGKHDHEETRATFSRSETHAPSIIVKNMDEAKQLGEFILGKTDINNYKQQFEKRQSKNLDPLKDFERVGVINQTTMLATETQAIADYFKQVMIEKYGEESMKEHFADTRDTLCYATNENQEATYGLLNSDADIAIVVGGFNSSNTSHLVELCEEKLPTFFISSEKDLLSSAQIRHYKFREKEITESENYLPAKSPSKIIITSGASCPDAVVEGVIRKLIDFYKSEATDEEALTHLYSKTNT